MRSNTILKSLTALLFLVVICHSSLLAVNQPEVLLGGYYDMDNEDKIDEIDTFIKDEIEELVDYVLRRAEQQVVAGMNYRLTYFRRGTKV